MPETGELTIRLPTELKNRIAQIAEEQGVSINQLAMYIFAKEIGDIEAGSYISQFWKGHSKSDILAGV